MGTIIGASNAEPNYPTTGADRWRREAQTRMGEATYRYQRRGETAQWMLSGEVGDEEHGQGRNRPAVVRALGEYLRSPRDCEPEEYLRARGLNYYQE